MIVHVLYVCVVCTCMHVCMRVCLCRGFESHPSGSYFFKSYSGWCLKVFFMHACVGGGGKGGGREIDRSIRVCVH